jgi:hypothetical protein
MIYISLAKSSKVEPDAHTFRRLLGKEQKAAYFSSFLHVENHETSKAYPI